MPCSEITIQYSQKGERERESGGELYTLNSMSLTQFAMVEELAFLVKDNLPCKYLILSVEDALVNFLQNDTSLDGVLELKPMNSYNRLLIHRLADIFGFSHQSVGEGEERHLILERCPDTAMPAILVSDFLSQSNEMQSPMTFEVLRREEVIPGQRDNVGSESSLKERETAYFAARERIFSPDACQMNLIKERPKKDPVVARRMITRALGQPKDIDSSNEQKNKSLSAKHSTTCTTSKVHKFSGFQSTNSVRRGPQQSSDLTLTKGSSAAEEKESNTQENHLRSEHMGAAKRLFANALGMHQRDVNLFKCDETKKTGC
ncbi:hypothetical protein CDL12_27975 [Handroanthus impetiginosus]|uniref:R3H domain-containing protein n=1 Tax=Handroanthus impetiginosus TaxID=429701 RepID=A0A2G9G2J3_9LAMI|nr:hypothetical protein CDL12_27975 [Handroanthus impetiginosus]